MLWKISQAALAALYMDCLGEEFAIRSSFSTDVSSCAEGERETVLTVGTAQVRAGVLGGLQLGGWRMLK